MTTEPLLGPNIPPPRGGFDTLQTRIRIRRRRSAGIVASLVLILAVAGLILPPDSAEQPPDILVQGGAAIQWPSSQPDVRIFLVARPFDRQSTTPERTPNSNADS